MSLNSNTSTTMSSIHTDKSFPSVCIPYTVKNTTWMQVKEVFEQLFGSGSIERVDVIKRKRRDAYGAGTDASHTGQYSRISRDQEYCKVFVHFKEWPDTPEANQFRQHILAGNCMKIVYNEPWYWKCFKNNSQRHSYNRGATPYICKLVSRTYPEGPSSNVGGPGPEDPVPNGF